MTTYSMDRITTVRSPECTKIPRNGTNTLALRTLMLKCEYTAPFRQLYQKIDLQSRRDVSVLSTLLIYERINGYVYIIHHTPLLALNQCTVLLYWPISELSSRSTDGIDSDVPCQLCHTPICF